MLCCLFLQDGEELNVPKVMEMLWTKINATQNSEAREFLTEAISELPELPRQPDVSIRNVFLESKILLNIVFTFVFNASSFFSPELLLPFRCYISSRSRSPSCTPAS